MSDNIFASLRADHDKQRRLIDLVSKTHGDSEGRRELFERLRVEALSHAKVEERAFYAPLMALELTRDKAGHSIKEHHELEALFDELVERDMSDGGWLTRFRSLADKLQHHMDEEEHEVFQLAGKALVEKQKRDMAVHYEREKEAAMEAERAPVAS